METRKELLRFVYVEGLPVPKAADALNIKYQTAKTILKIYFETGLISRFSESKHKGFQSTTTSTNGSQLPEHLHSENSKRLCTTYAIGLAGYAHERCALSQSGGPAHSKLSGDSFPLPQVTDSDVDSLSMLDASKPLVS